jgi:hypothetical protein
MAAFAFEAFKAFGLIIKRAKNAGTAQEQLVS